MDVNYLMIHSQHLYASAHSDVYLVDGSVSRNHARLRVTPSEHLVWGAAILPGFFWARVARRGTRHTETTPPPPPPSISPDSLSQDDLTNWGSLSVEDYAKPSPDSTAPKVCILRRARTGICGYSPFWAR